LFRRKKGSQGGETQGGILFYKPPGKEKKFFGRGGTPLNCREKKKGKKEKSLLTSKNWQGRKEIPLRRIKKMGKTVLVKGRGQGEVDKKKLIPSKRERGIRPPTGGRGEKKSLRAGCQREKGVLSRGCGEEKMCKVRSRSSSTEEERKKEERRGDGI